MRDLFGWLHGLNDIKLPDIKNTGVLFFFGWNSLLGTIQKIVLGVVAFRGHPDVAICQRNSTQVFQSSCEGREGGG